MSKRAAWAILTLAILVGKFVIFMVATNTLGVGVYAVGHGCGVISRCPLVGQVVFFVCATGIVLSQGLAPICALRLLERSGRRIVVRNEWLLVVASVLGPVSGGIVAMMVGSYTYDPRNVAWIATVLLMWVFVDVATTMSAVFWSVWVPERDAA
jgi:hypothetical protein